MLELRESCLLCAAKHVAQARVLLLESKKGYDYHVVYALGHMAEAEDETTGDFPLVAEWIRRERKTMEDDAGHVPQFRKLICFIISMIDKESAQVLAKLEAEFSGLSVEDLTDWWHNPQGEHEEEHTATSVEDGADSIS